MRWSRLLWIGCAASLLGSGLVTSAASAAAPSYYGTCVSFDGAGADTVQQIRGGAASLVARRAGAGFSSSGIQVDPLFIDMGPGSLAKLVKPLGEFFRQNPVRIAVEVWNKVDQRETAVTDFGNCLIASVRFPALDQNASTMNSVTLQLLPDAWAPLNSPRAGWAAAQWPARLAAASWRSGLSRNFTLEVGGVNYIDVSRISPIVVGAEDVSAQRAKGPAAWSAVPPTSENLIIVASGSTAKQMRAWMAEVIASNGALPPRQVEITYRNEYSTPLLKLTGLGAVPVALRAASRSGQPAIEVELEVAVAQWSVADPSVVTTPDKAIGIPLERAGTVKR